MAFATSSEEIDDDAGVTAAFAADQLGISPNMVSNWARRGWLTRDGRRRFVAVLPGKFDGQLRYRYGDILDAEADTRDNPNSSRSLVRRVNAASRAA